MYSSSTLTKRNHFIHVGTANTIHERPGVYFFYNFFSYFRLLFVNIIYTRWCIIGQVLNGEWKELLIRQVIITSAPTNIFTTCRYFYFRQCVFASFHYECAHQYIYNVYFYLRQLVFLFPPTCICN